MEQVERWKPNRNSIVHPPVVWFNSNAKPTFQQKSLHSTTTYLILLLMPLTRPNTPVYCDVFLNNKSVADNVIIQTPLSNPLPNEFRSKLIYDRHFANLVLFVFSIFLIAANVFDTKVGDKIQCTCKPPIMAWHVLNCRNRNWSVRRASFSIKIRHFQRRQTYYLHPYLRWNRDSLLVDTRRPNNRKRNKLSFLYWHCWILFVN